MGSNNVMQQPVKATSSTPKKDTSSATVDKTQDDNLGLMSFTYAKPRIKSLIDRWNHIEEDVKRARMLRYMKMDKETLNGLGLFKEDETFIGVRLIDTNCKAEQPPYTSYITQSRRSLIFEQPGGFDIPGIQKLEHAFTIASRYEGWDKPFIKTVDGAIFLGWDWVEVCLDITKPGHFSVEHVGNERLLFDHEAEDIQQQELVLRFQELSKIQLLSDITQYNFNKEQVRKILDATEENQGKTKDILYKIYKVFFKKDDVVYSAYYGGDKTTDWLRVPTLFSLGRADIEAGPTLPTGASDANQQPILNFSPLQEGEYPFYILPYIESENPKIVELRGRGFLDEPAQEGASALMSATVNGTMRAACIFGSPDNTNPAQNLDTAAPKQIDCKIRHGGIYDKPIKFWSPPYPPAVPLQVLEALGTANKAETSQVNYAAKNRKDSRKTAEEIKASQQDEQQLTAVQVTTLSAFMRQVYTRCYSIYANRIQQGKITVSEDIKQLVKGTYVMRAAGDVDVVERGEKLQQLMSAWPVVSKTPLANEFLKIYIRCAFPDDSMHLTSMLDQGNQAKQLVQQLSTLLFHAVIQPQPPKVANPNEQQGSQGQGGMPPLKPEFQGLEPQLMQVSQMVQQFLQNGQASSNPQQQSVDSFGDVAMMSPANLPTGNLTPAIGGVNAT